VIGSASAAVESLGLGITTRPKGGAQRTVPDTFLILHEIVLILASLDHPGLDSTGAICDPALGDPFKQYPQFVFAALR